MLLNGAFLLRILVYFWIALDNKSKKLEDNDLTIIFLPPYSPELNPTERFFPDFEKLLLIEYLKILKSKKN